MQRSVLVALSLVALVGIAVWAVLTQEAAAPSGVQGPEGAAGSRTAGTVVERIDRARAVDPNGSEGRPEELGGTQGAQGDSERGPDPATLEPGAVRVRVVDRATGSALDEVTVTLASERRFARFPVHSARDGARVVAVSPGHYRATAFRAGFEGGTLEGIEVRSGEETDLGTLRLAPGQSVLQGRVSGPALLGRLTVEIHGPGRRPCEVCGEGVCEVCGYGAAHSERQVGVAEPFTFERLAAGELQLWVRDAERRVVHFEKVAIGTAEQRWIDVDVTTVTVDVDVFDKNGKPMLGEWSENGVLWTAPVRFHFLQGDSCVAIAEAKEPETRPQVDPNADAAGDADGKKGSSEPKELEARRAAERAAMGRSPRKQAPEARPRVDVARSGGRSMWPRIVPTNPRTVPLRSVPVRPGRTRIQGVPVGADRIVVTCGPHFTTPEKLDLPGYDGDPIVVRFGARCGIDSKMVQKMGLVSCTACHQLPGSLQWLDSGRARRRGGP